MLTTTNFINNEQYITSLNGVASGNFTIKRTSDYDEEQSMISAEIIKSTSGNCLTYSEIKNIFHPIESVCGILPKKNGQLTLHQHDNKLQIYNQKTDQLITIYKPSISEELKKISDILYNQDIISGNFDDIILTLTKNNNDKINININLNITSLDLDINLDGVILIKNKNIIIVETDTDSKKVLAWYKNDVQWIDKSIIYPI